MKKIIPFLVLLITFQLEAQSRKHSTFYEQRVTLFELLPIDREDILFVGNSITNGNEWFEVFDDKNVKNRGISGDTSEGVLDRIHTLSKGKPRKMFLMIGINDIARNIPLDTIESNIAQIIIRIKTDSPRTEIYLQSVLPVNPNFGMFAGHMKPDSIRALNNRFQTLADNQGLTYIDLYTHFTEGDTDKLSPKYTNDGVHLLGEGYLCWTKLILPYVKK